MNEEPNFTGEPRFPRFKQGDRVVYMLNSEPKFCGTVTQVNEHQGTTESTYYYTYHILFDHGMDAKWVNEFWLMPCEDPKPEKLCKSEHSSEQFDRIIKDDFKKQNRLNIAAMASGRDYIAIPLKYLIKVEEEKEPKFKVGDKVIFIPTGKVKVVSRINANSLYTVTEPNGQSPLYVRETELAPYIEHNAPKFKVGDRVRNVKSDLCGIALNIEHGIVEVGIPYDKEKHYWNTDIVELFEPTEQTEAEKKPNVGSIKIPVEVDLTDGYLGAYTADLAKEIALKVANKYTDPKQLVNFYKEFGADAQKVLDFASNEINQRKMRNIFAQEETEGNSLAENNEAIPDGVYFIAGGSDGEINTKTYAKYDPSMTAAPFPTKYIGVKIGHRAIAVALEDLPGNSNGELRLLPRDHTSPEISEHYSWDDEADKHRFNAFEDFDGKGNTERLKEYGSKIEVPEIEWIPSMGELGLLMMHATDVNRAIELAGGKPIKSWHWSSTEHSQYLAWLVGFSDGRTGNLGKPGSYAVRAVAAF